MSFAKKTNSELAIPNCEIKIQCELYTIYCLLYCYCKLYGVAINYLAPGLNTFLGHILSVTVCNRVCVMSRKHGFWLWDINEQKQAKVKINTQRVSQSVHTSLVPKNHHTPVPAHLARHSSSVCESVIFESRTWALL